MYPDRGSRQKNTKGRHGAGGECRLAGLWGDIEICAAKAKKSRAHGEVQVLFVSFVILSCTVGMGAYLTRKRPQYLSFVHGGSGFIGLTVLLVAMKEHLLSGKFADDAVVLLMSGLFLGLVMTTLERRGKNPPMAVLLVHASVGGLAYLLVAGLAFGR
jgi:hypothetical protein